MMKQLHVWPFTSLAKKIWQKYQFTQLPNAFKNHFWKGGSGKWEVFFKHEHLMILKALGIEKILVNYQYHAIYQKFIKLTSISHDQMSSDLHLHKHNIYYHDEHYDTYQFLEEVHGKENCMKCGPLSIVCHDHETLLNFAKCLDRPYLHKMILAGVHEVPQIM
jgi:hypothetical protein